MREIANSSFIMNKKQLLAFFLVHLISPKNGSMSHLGWVVVDRRNWENGRFIIMLFAPSGIRGWSGEWDCQRV